MWQNWREVAASGVTTFGAGFVRGRVNQGLPVLIGRWIDKEWASDMPEILGFFMFGALIAWLWMKATRWLTDEQAWAGWVAWICVLHPLSWSHNFVFALPLCAFALDAAWKRGSRAQIFLAFMGLFITGLLTVNTTKAIRGLFDKIPEPEPIGTFFELLSARSWGVLLLAWVLVAVERQVMGRTSSRLGPSRS
jgi:hypothetical protein